MQAPPSHPLSLAGLPQNPDDVSEPGGGNDLALADDTGASSDDDGEGGTREKWVPACEDIIVGVDGGPAVATRVMQVTSNQW